MQTITSMISWSWKLWILFRICWACAANPINPSPQTVLVGSSCNRSKIMEEVKSYLEREDFAVVLTRFKHLWINPQTFWDNLQQIDNLCNSEEAILLQTYCGNRSQFQTDSFYFWFWQPTWELKEEKRGKVRNLNQLRLLVSLLDREGKDLDFCKGVKGLPMPAQNWDFEKTDKLLAKLMNEARQDDTGSSKPVTFGKRIQQRLDSITKDKAEKANLTEVLKNLTEGFNNLTQRVTSLEQEVAKNFTAVRIESAGISAALSTLDKYVKSLPVKIEQDMQGTTTTTPHDSASYGTTLGVGNTDSQDTGEIRRRG